MKRKSKKPRLYCYTVQAEELGYVTGIYAHNAKEAKEKAMAGMGEWETCEGEFHYGKVTCNKPAEGDDEEKK